jgi:hypothetical protein
LLTWIAHKPLNAPVLFLLLFGVKGAAVGGEKATERTIFRLDDFLDLFRYIQWL